MLLDAPAQAPVRRTRQLDRRPQTREKLHRLRRELAKMANPASAGEARDGIADAILRAGLGGWAVPSLADREATAHCADGSVSLRLIAHTVVINPSGAFRIIDEYSPKIAYFEMQGRGGHAFVMPPRRRAR